MLELFADRSRRAVVEAGDVARALGQGFVGAEHLLLGLIAEHNGVAAPALDRLGVTDKNVRRELLTRYPRGEHPGRGGCCRSLRKVSAALSLSLAEMQRLNDARIETEDLLLALLRTDQQNVVRLLEAGGVPVLMARDRRVRSRAPG